MTAIRMARKATWTIWCLLYAAKGAARSWIMAVRSDIRWLVACSPLFADVDATTLAGWLVLAMDFPHKTAAALKKAGDSPAAVNLAIAIQARNDGYIEPVAAVVDVPTIWRCNMCEYTCGSRNALSQHECVVHGCTSVISWCIDTLWCTVCGLSFEHLASVR